MCEYIKTKFPHIYLYTSTNGLAFTEEKVRQLARSGIDEVTFSIDGSSQENYVKYRQRGNFDKAIANMRAMLDERAKTGSDLPFVNWRYILFKWNDSDEEMGRARAMAKEFGVDRLCWEITDHPEDSFSRRFAPGTPDYERIRHEIWDNSGLGNAIPGATPRAEIDVHTVLPDLPFLTRPSTPVSLTAHVKNVSGRPFRAKTTQGRRVVRLGAQLMDDERRADQSRLRARVAARRSRPGPIGRRQDRSHRAGAAGPLRIEVRPGQRRRRLVRSVRLANDYSRTLG